MSDTLTTTEWINDCRTTHAAATDVLLRNRYELERETDLAKADIVAIESAHRNFPRALSAIDKVKAKHQPVMSDDLGVPVRTGRRAKLVCSTCRGDFCGYAEFPCPTIEAIEDETLTMG